MANCAEPAPTRECRSSDIEDRRSRSRAPPPEGLVGGVALTWGSLARAGMSEVFSRGSGAHVAAPAQLVRLIPWSQATRAILPT